VQPGIAVLALLGVLAAGIMAIYALALVHAPPGTADGGPFLSGHRPQEHAVSRFHVRWYAVTMVFLAFDMEMAFMFPWALVVGAVGPKAVMEMFAFLALLQSASSTPGGKVRCGGFEAAAVRLRGRTAGVLVAAAPDGTIARLGVEAQLRRRGWPQALSPAAADLPVVCGDPGQSLAQAIDIAWRDMPGPRAMVSLEPDAAEARVSAVFDRPATGGPELRPCRPPSARRLSVPRP
jgi:NADH-quinone oxidoreductase subunit A